MDISVIVPIYGVEHYVERCLRSLFEQTKLDGVEFILVNDCTKDNSMSIVHRVVAEYPDLSIKILEHSQNRGLAATRQSGFEISCGEYILHIDSDDWCELTMLEDMYAKAKADDADIVVADIYYGDCGIFRHAYGADAKRYIVDGLLSHSDKDYNMHILANGNGYSYNIWNKMIRRELYTNNSISCNNGVDNSEDVLLSVKLMWYANKMSYLTNPYVHYNKTNSSSMTKTFTESNFINAVLCYLYVVDFLKERGCYDQYAEQVEFITLKSLEEAVKHTRGDVQRRIISKFTHLKFDVLSERRMTPTARIAFYLATHGCRHLANLIYTLVGILKPSKSIVVNLAD